MNTFDELEATGGSDDEEYDGEDVDLEEDDFDDPDEPEERDESESRREWSPRRRRHEGDEQRSRRPNLAGQRVAILVDVQNMYHSAKKIYGRNLSYAKLLEHTVRGRTLTRAIAYIIDRQGVDQEAFVDHLKHIGFHVRRKELIERPDGSRKGSWDLGLAWTPCASRPRSTWSCS